MKLTKLIGNMDDDCFQSLLVVSDKIIDYDTASVVGGNQQIL